MQKSKFGILSNGVPTDCHQLEAPELEIEIDGTGAAREKCESTFQLPIGEHSAMSQLRLGEMSPGEAIISVVLHYRSNWVSGKTWRSSLRKLSKLTGMSMRYLRDKLSSLMSNDWLSYISKGLNVGSRYQLVHHNCDSSEVPTDKNGRALKCAIPRGRGGILERLFAGDICWKSALIWLMLKVHSDWKTGKTHFISIETLRQWVGMSPQTVLDCLKELTEAGLLARLSCKQEQGQYQLYPRPNGNPKPVYRPKREPTSDGRSMRIDGDWRLSLNEKWRLNVETGEIERRKSRRHGIWRGLTLGDVIPKPIAEAFDFSLLVNKQAKDGVRGDCGVTDTAQCVTDTAQCVTDSAQYGLFGVYGFNGSVG